ncbi:ATP-binding protein [Streptomyces sp. NPDC047928]|uniref:ATP-binding protein n=1 Tax=unclassified Streptomyces TaxID=2593676 RepID=UPI003723E98D
MKQSAAKTIGVAALGAAFAATAAGSAAAIGAVPTGAALDTATKTLPIEQAAAQLPAGATELVATGQEALGAVTQGMPETPIGTPADPVVGLLGGLPLGNLPVGGALPVAGLG